MTIEQLEKEIDSQFPLHIYMDPPQEYDVHMSDDEYKELQISLIEDLPEDYVYKDEKLSGMRHVRIGMINVIRDYNYGYKIERRKHSAWLTAPMKLRESDPDPMDFTNEE